MTTIIFNSLENALRWCKNHDVSTKYVANLKDGWMLKYPGTHERYEANRID